MFLFSIIHTKVFLSLPEHCQGADLTAQAKTKPEVFQMSTLGDLAFFL